MFVFPMCMSLCVVVCRCVSLCVVVCRCVSLCVVASFTDVGVLYIISINSRI